ncbi:MAG: hypothetical protein CL928_00130 [Deltaproteobacteria bacterium]|nr:hypothetical protein [Deltaproteobacteria bacterium]
MARYSSKAPPAWLLIYLAVTLPILSFSTGWTGTFVWSIVCAAGAESLGGGRPTRHIAGALLALLGGCALVYLTAIGIRPMAIVLLLPAVVGVHLARLLGKRPHEFLGTHPLRTALCFIVPVAGLYQLGLMTGQLPAVTDDFLFHVHEIEGPEPLTEEEQLAALDVIGAVLGGADVAPVTLPRRLKKRHSGDTYVTLYRQTRGINMTRGWAPPGPLWEQLLEATQAAVVNAPKTASWNRDFSEVRIQVDLAGDDHLLSSGIFLGLVNWVVEKTLPKTARWDPLVYRFEPGIDGLRIETGGKSGVLLPSDLMTRGLLTPRDRDNRFRVNDLAKAWAELSGLVGLAGQPLKEHPVLRFRTTSFAQPIPTERRAVSMLRANVPLEGDLDEGQLLESIEMAGKWLLEQVEEDGRFDYQYFPHLDSHGSGYNEVRHAGSVYGLFHMAHVARSEPTLRDQADAYTAAGLKALGRVYRNLGPPPGTKPSDGFVTFLEGREGRKSNSGGPALTLLSFLMRPQPDQVGDPEVRARLVRPEDDAIIRGLARTLVAMIDDEGKVYRRWTEAQAGGGVKEEPLYFPGEVMLALCVLHDRTGEAQWLDAAKRIGRRQVALMDHRRALPDHWVMQAIDYLDRFEPDEPLWREAGYEMGRRFIADQFPPHPEPFDDYRGAFRRIQEVPRTTRAAARGEAIGGIARIAWRHGDPSWHWERSLLEGARHLVEQQFTVDNSFFFPKPEEVLGAIRMGIVDNHCRIDNNQHAIVALGNALTALRHRRPGWGERGEGG